jgi:hypothetical protein
MSLWACRQCTTAYAVGLPACPQCGGTEYTEDWNMPKITRAGLSVEPASTPGEPVEQLPEGQSATAVGPAPGASAGSVQLGTGEGAAAASEPEPEPAPEPPPAPAQAKK